MKKTFATNKSCILIALAPLIFASTAWSAHVIDLAVSQNDLTQYKEKAEKYIFKHQGQLKINNQQSIQIDEMETRGQGSISYRRRNFGLKLSQMLSLGRIASNKINLLSMGADSGYISTRLGLMIAENLKIGQGLPTEYVEVKINGQSNGLYTLVEKPKSALDNSPFIVRRGYKSRFIMDEAETSKKLSLAQIEEIKAAANSIYTAIETKTGYELFSTLKQKMDIKSYMRWMVMNSLLQNGDYPDEVFFYVDADLYQQGQIYFRIQPWDFDDLFKKMHNVSINSIEASKPENTSSILYSYEDKLDRAFAPVNFYMYEQLKATARALFNNELHQVNTDKVLLKIGHELSEYLDNKDILQMSRLDSGRKGQAYTKKEIIDLLYLRKKQIDERREELKEKIK